MKYCFHVLIEVNEFDQWQGFKTSQHWKDYDGDIGGAVADSLASLEVDLDHAAEDAFEGLNVQVTVNLAEEDWAGKEPE